MAVYSSKTSPYTVEEAIEILKNADMTKALRRAAENPRPGEAFLFTYDGFADRKDDWRADGYQWVHGGVRRWPKKSPQLRKTYHRIKTGNGNFRRYSFQLLDQGSTVVLIHYLGELPVKDPRCHGTAKKNVERRHTRSATSLLQKMMKSDKQMEIYLRICNEASSEDLPGMRPRNVEQVRNVERAQKRKKRVSQDDILSVLEYSYLLDKFIWWYQLLPDVAVMMGDVNMCAMFEELTLKVKRKPILISYDTTFKLGDYYMSTMVYRHEFFKESPIVPLCFIFHRSRKLLFHWTFMNMFAIHCSKMNRDNIVLASDMESAIEESIAIVFPTVKRVVCWNHIRQDIKGWIKKHGGASEDFTFYESEVFHLLKSTSKGDYEAELRRKKMKWSKAFRDYFESNLHQSIIDSYSIAEPGSGITSNISESFNVVLKRLVNKWELNIVSMIRSLYNLQNDYMRELLYGLCNEGSYHLKEEYHCHAKELGKVKFPEATFVEEHVPFDYVKRRKEPPPSACRIAEARGLGLS